MSLVGTLGRIAVGVAMAKGVGTLMNKNRGGSGGGGLGGAAKSDGEIDQAEQQKIVANLGDEVSDAEREFVLNEMKAPLDVQGFINSIPPGAGSQVYMMSLLGIDLDSREEAQYLDTLRKGVSMSEEQANAIHQQLGVPTLYS